MFSVFSSAWSWKRSHHIWWWSEVWEIPKASDIFSVRFRPYLYGQTLLLQTDHKSLTWLLNLQEPEGKIVHWMETLQDYKFKIGLGANMPMQTSCSDEQEGIVDTGGATSIGNGYQPSSILPPTRSMHLSVPLTAQMHYSHLGTQPSPASARGPTPNRHWRLSTFETVVDIWAAEDSHLLGESNPIQIYLYSAFTTAMVKSRSSEYACK